MTTYRTPDVYVEEISVFPPSVAEVETAIPAFIGYTNSATRTTADDLRNVPTAVTSLPEYESLFGAGPKLAIDKIVLDDSGNFVSAELSDTNTKYLYDSLRLFFNNGGGKCYIVSVGSDETTTSKDDLIKGLQQIARQDEPTILLFPDAAALSANDLASVQQEALKQCSKLGDRVALLETRYYNTKSGHDTEKGNFRSKIGINNLKYGAAYAPWLRISYAKNFGYNEINTATISNSTGDKTLTQLANSDAGLEQLISDADAAVGTGDASAIADAEKALMNSFSTYSNIVRGINSVQTDCPPSGAIAGIYSLVDSTRGVWKAPANVSLAGVIEPTYYFDTDETDDLNIDTVAGKSINAIRAFSGKGTLVFGARTLAGNDNEWRYISVRRFFNMVEESVKKSTSWAVFESNDVNTWVRVRGMIENYLTQKWREGALAGSTTKEAFFVRCGLGVTMNADDILNGYMKVEIGMAAVRPAEFIVLKFSHKLQTS